MNGLLELQAALIAHLRAQASLQPWLGDPVRVYDEPPKPLVWPYVTFGRATAQSIGGVGTELSEHVLNLLCVSRFDGQQEVKAVTAALTQALDGAEVALSGVRLVSLRVVFVDVFRAADFKMVYGLVRLRAATEPL